MKFISRSFNIRVFFSFFLLIFLFLPVTAAYENARAKPIDLETQNNSSLRLNGNEGFLDNDSTFAPSIANQVVLPTFELPYDKVYNGNVAWTGGPHLYGDTNRRAKFPSGYGSGLDFSCGCGFEVLAMADGEVIYAGWGAFGYQVAIKHYYGGSVLIYGHLREGSIKVKKGDPVKQGDPIGNEGSSNSDQIHLHIELRDGSPTCTSKCVRARSSDSCKDTCIYIDKTNDVCLGGNPVGWDDLLDLVDRYRIGGYIADSEGYESYNYDGSAVLGNIKIIDQFPFLDQPGDVYSSAIARVNENFVCNSTTDCEINTFHELTKFATNANFYASSITSGEKMSMSSLSNEAYLNSSNQIRVPVTDTTPPSGTFTSPSNGASISTGSLTISANASDNSGGSGVREVRFSAFWPGLPNWVGINNDSSSPYSINWDMCGSGVPKGAQVELGMEVWDNAGNVYYYSQHHTNPRITFNYDCSGTGLPAVGFWNAEAWMNKDMAGYVNRNEHWTDFYIQKDWGDGRPYSDFPNDNFSFKIYRDINFKGGQYFFRICSDDGLKLLVDNNMKFNEWWDRGGCLQTDHWLSPGYHPVEVQYFEHTGNAYIKLFIWGEEFPRPELDEPDGRITSPTNNSYSNLNPISIWAEASDDKSGVEYVKLKVYHCQGGCQWRDVGYDYQAPYKWDWSSSGFDGQQVKFAIDIRDKSGKTRGNAGGEVVVNVDHSAPTVSFTSPASNTTDEDKIVNLAVSASDNFSGVNRVTFFAGYQGGTNYWHEIGTDTNGGDGWGMTWNGTSLANGTYASFMATAHDQAGNAAGTVTSNILLGARPKKNIYLPMIQSALPPNYQPSWSLISEEDELTLWDIQMMSSTDGWMIGGYCCNPMRSVIRHFDGNSWTDVTHPGQYQLFTIEMVNKDEGWAGGQFGELLHYQNGTWKRETGVTNNDIDIIDMVSVNDGWAIANKRYPNTGSDILRYQNGGWSVFATGFNSLLSLDMVSSTDGWIVGTDGQIFHYSGGEWKPYPSPTTGWIYKVQMLSENAGWAIVHDHSLIKYANGKWSFAEAPYGRPWALNFISEYEGWIASEDNIYHYLNGKIHDEGSPSGDTVYGFDMISPTSGWACGSGGAVLRYK